MLILDRHIVNSFAYLAKFSVSHFFCWSFFHLFQKISWWKYFIILQIFFNFWNNFLRKIFGLRKIKWTICHLFDFSFHLIGTTFFSFFHFSKLDLNLKFYSMLDKRKLVGGRWFVVIQWLHGLCVLKNCLSRLPGCFSFSLSCFSFPLVLL